MTVYKTDKTVNNCLAKFYQREKRPTYSFSKAPTLISAQILTFTLFVSNEACQKLGIHATEQCFERLSIKCAYSSFKVLLVLIPRSCQQVIDIQHLVRNSKPFQPFICKKNLGKSITQCSNRLTKPNKPEI